MPILVVMVDTKMTAIPKFIFMLYTVHIWVLNAIVLILLTTNRIFGGHLGFHAIE